MCNSNKEDDHKKAKINLLEGSKNVDYIYTTVLSKEVWITLAHSILALAMSTAAI